MKMSKWKLERDDLNDHRIWSTESSGKTAYYLADHSGWSPDHTEHPPLRVDPKRRATVGAIGDSVYFNVPVHVEHADNEWWQPNRTLLYCGCNSRVFEALQKLIPQLQVDQNNMSSEWKALVRIIKEMDREGGQ